MLTIGIIALGITALVGVQAAVDAIQNKLVSDFSKMGTTTLVIKNRGSGMQARMEGRRPKMYPPIKYAQAKAFKTEFEEVQQTPVSISAFVQANAVLTHLDKQTQADVRVMGGDTQYLPLNGLEIATGRNFTPNEVLHYEKVILLGQDVLKKLFKQTDPIGKTVSIQNQQYRVVGTLASKGSSSSMSGDNQCLIPVSVARQLYYGPGMSFSLSIGCSAETMESMNDEATGLFRRVRKDRLGEADSFSIARSDSMLDMLNEMTGVLRTVSWVISILTLLGAAIGLMNIMMVSVVERTKEIGTRKALGASQKVIRFQFFAESIVIGQLGAFLGCIIGIILGNLAAYWMETAFFIPTTWLIAASIICILISVLSGYYPARKAARLDPIEALRRD